MQSYQRQSVETQPADTGPEQLTWPTIPWTRKLLNCLHTHFEMLMFHLLSSELLSKSVQHQFFFLDFEYSGTPLYISVCLSRSSNSFDELLGVNVLRELLL